MKKVSIVVIALLLVAGAVYASQINAVKEAGDVTVKLLIENDPVKVGDNTIVIELLDGNGKSLSDADVSVYYFMPSMPAMNYTVQASPDGTKYSAVIKPVMPGPWDADINVKRQGEEVQKATFSFDAK